MKTIPASAIPPDLAFTLHNRLTDRSCIVGIGNRMRGDDGAGPALIDARPPHARGAWLDAGAAPENLLEPVARLDPDLILLVDAVAFGGPPGHCRLFDPKEQDTAALSTHAGSLSLLCDYWSVRTRAPILLLAIQPQSLSINHALSPLVLATIHTLACHLAPRPKAVSRSGTTPPSPITPNPATPPR